MVAKKNIESVLKQLIIPITIYIRLSFSIISCNLATLFNCDQAFPISVLSVCLGAMPVSVSVFLCLYILMARRGEGGDVGRHLDESEPATW